jgi:hypothetical protein
MEQVSISGYVQPWHSVKLQFYSLGRISPAHWCDKQNWQENVDYIILTEKRVINYLFKNAKHATMFRLYWSSYIKDS